MVFKLRESTYNNAHPLRIWNLKVVVDGGELTRNINKKKPDGLQA